MVKPVAIDQYVFDHDADMAARCEALSSALRATSQATATLAVLAMQRGWTEKVRARKLASGFMAPPARFASLLGVTPDETLGFREVELVCGQRVLSRAANWYAASRLPDSVNAQLENSDEPFGLLINDLKPGRSTLELEPFWAPGAASVPAALFQLTAVVSGLVNETRTPLALVRETYLSDTIV